MLAVHAASLLLSTACSVGFQGSTRAHEGCNTKHRASRRRSLVQLLPALSCSHSILFFSIPPTHQLYILPSFLSGLPLAVFASCPLSLSLPLSLPPPPLPFSPSLPLRSLSIICWLCRSGRSVGRRLLPVPLRPVKPTQNVHQGVLARCKAKGQGGGVCVGVCVVKKKHFRLRGKEKTFSIVW